MSRQKIITYTRKDGKRIDVVKGGSKRRDMAGTRPITGPEFGLEAQVDRAYRRWCERRGLKP